MTAESADPGERAGREQTIAPGFEQAKGEILQRAEAAREELLEQTARQHQLKEQVGYLQEVVKDLGGRVILAVGVLEGKAAVRLHVEALILDLPAHAPRILGESADMVPPKVEVGDPDKAGGLGCDRLPAWFRDKRARSVDGRALRRHASQSGWPSERSA
jgi:hypothetical protein